MPGAGFWGFRSAVFLYEAVTLGYRSASGRREAGWLRNGCIIGQAVIELSTEQQPVTKSTLALKLLSMADRDSDDERVLLYWIARKAINQPQYLVNQQQQWA